MKKENHRVITKINASFYLRIHTLQQQQQQLEQARSNPLAIQHLLDRPHLHRTLPRQQNHLQLHLNSLIR